MSRARDFSQINTSSPTFAGTVSASAIVSNNNLTVDTNTLHVDSVNNRVGVGTANPTQRLEVASGRSYFFANDEPYSVYVAHNSSTSGAFLGGTSTGSLQISSVGGTNLMQVDSSGRVTIPNKPMFFGYPTVDYGSGGMPEGNILFVSVINNGNHYNATNGRFTAPVTGYYMSTFFSLQLSNSAFRLTKNGSTYAQTNHAVATMSYITTGSSVIVQLNANDYINMYRWNGGGYYNAWTYWSVEQIA